MWILTAYLAIAMEGDFSPLREPLEEFTAAVVGVGEELDPPAFLKSPKAKIDESFFADRKLQDFEFLVWHRRTYEGLLFSCGAPHMQNRDAQLWAIEVLIERASHPDHIPFSALEAVFFALVRLPSIVDQEYPHLSHEFGEAFVAFMRWMEEACLADIFDGRADESMVHSSTQE